MDVSGHDADLDFIRRDHAGAVGSEQPGAPALHPVLGAYHVAHRDALGNADHEIEVGVDRLVDRGSGERRRHVNHRHVGAGFFLGFPDRRKNRYAFVRRAGFLRIDPRDVAGPAVRVFLAHLGVKLAGFSGDALRHHPGILVDQYRHDYARAPAALTTLTAASAMLRPEMIGSPDSARIFLPRSTLVPSSRTTSGTLRCTSFAAATMPSAMTSHFMMPPKMFTSIALTFGFLSMILNASVTFSAEAPPPTSRKLAGPPP